MSIPEKFDGQAWTIRQLFGGRRYELDNYQREFSWETKHLEELLTDLSERFLAKWQPGQDPTAVAEYPPYFLGPIVTHHKHPHALIVDGQQRLTVLMLLIMWLCKVQGDREDAVEGLVPLAYFDSFGKKRFAVEDEEDASRHKTLLALFQGEEIDSTADASASVRTLVARYNDLDSLFPEGLRGDALPSFIYWLLERVYLVEISTTDAALALETFETMNDRGLRLNGLDLLKSFVIGEVGPADQSMVSQIWRARMTALVDADSNANVGFVKNWFRAKLSRSATDDAAISKSFEKWIRREHGDLGIKHPGEFMTFVNHLDRLSRRYVEVLEASKQPKQGLDAVYANATNTVTLQLPLILAAVAPEDDTATFLRKASMVAGYLDIVAARHIVNSRDFGYDALSSGVFALAREIRNLDADTLAKRLGDEIAALPVSFDGVATYGLRPRNKSRTRYLLARMTAWLEIQCNAITTTPAYAARMRDLLSHEIEHVWANKPDLQPQVQLRKFEHIRNSFGGLLLLPKSFNASYGALPYAGKIDQYWGQGTILAKSLHPACHKNNPGFRKVMEHYGLAFQPYESAFDERAIAQRQSLYQKLCEAVWDPTQYGLVVPVSTGRQAATERSRVHFGVTVARLVERGYIDREAKLVGLFRDAAYHAQLTADGRIQIDSGEIFDSPSPAAIAVLNRGSWNGWTFWHVTRPDGTKPTLDAIRAAALRAGITS
ncbi:MAG TPA: DUF262 domain-containing protein [Candidatus Limnocylindrales bacterium]|nr:DUF262 domain-containing protein [Candidatus Limnocylindrales bacterium]